MRRPAFAAVFILLLMVGVSLVHAQPAFEQRSLEEALNPDGTLKRGVQGSFKVEGYTMRTGKNGEPIFEPQTQHTASGTWDAQFGLPTPGVAGEVYAVVADGQGNVYAVAFFGVVSGVNTSVNNIARYNMQTNSWSTWHRYTKRRKWHWVCLCFCPCDGWARTRLCGWSIHSGRGRECKPCGAL